MKTYTPPGGIVPRVLPHEQFHDRTRMTDPFTTATSEAAKHLAQRSREINAVAAYNCDLWPVERPSRQRCFSAAFRRVYHPTEKLVMLALCACMDDDGVVVAHMPKFAVFCGLGPKETVATLRKIEQRLGYILFHRTTSPEGNDLDFAALVVRPDMWPRPGAAQRDGIDLPDPDAPRDEFGAQRTPNGNLVFVPLPAGILASKGMREAVLAFVTATGPTPEALARAVALDAERIRRETIAHALMSGTGTTAEGLRPISAEDLQAALAPVIAMRACGPDGVPTA